MFALSTGLDFTLEYVFAYLHRSVISHLTLLCISFLSGKSVLNKAEAQTLRARTERVLNGSSMALTLLGTF